MLRDINTEKMISVGGGAFVLKKQWKNSVLLSENASSHIHPPDEHFLAIPQRKPFSLKSSDQF